MSTLSITTDTAGQVGVVPRIVKVSTTDSFATVTALNYLKPAIQSFGFTFYPSDIVALTYGTNVSQFFTLDISGSDITLVPDLSNIVLPVVDNDFVNFSGTTGTLKDSGYSPSNAAKTKVVMANGAVIANHIACYADTTGTVGVDSATAINGGNIQAGLNATAGTVTSFPSTTLSGKLVVAAVNNGSGNFNTTISNAAAVGQSQVVSVPDSGATTANFILSKTSGTQHITVGSLEVDAGNVIAGISGTAGFLQSFPASANGSLKIAAVANSGNTITTISNAAMGQASVVSIPDPATATANFAVAPAALVNNNLVKASGTAGLVVDAGARLIANTTASYAGGGTSNTFAATGLTVGAKGSAVIRASTNSVSITKALPGTDTLAITFSADPGAGTTVDYIYATAAQS